MACKLCSETKKTWKGSDRRCAFVSGVFSDDNYVCETASNLKNLVAEHHTELECVDYQYCDDDHYATIKVDNCDLGEQRYLAMWVSWYKSRGRTQSIWLLPDIGAPVRPTESQVLAVTSYLASSLN